MKRWEDHYKARVDNRFYLRSFIIKYKRFLDEIIINIKSMPEKGIVFKEEGCGIPTDKYEKPSFGDERLMPVSKWVSLVNPDYYIVDNAGCDLYLFFNNK